MTSILSRKGLLLFTLYNMPLHHLPTFIHTKASTLTFPSKPSATIPPSPIFCRLQSFFTVSMIEDWGGIFGLVSPWPWDIGRLLHSPNIVGDFGYGWGNKNGLMWIHGPKGNACLCQDAAQLYHKPYQQMKPFCMINPAKKNYLCVCKSVLDIHERKR